MSLVMISLEKTAAVVITDTQVSDEHSQPVGFMPKVTYLPEPRMLVTTTGDTAIADPWLVELEACDLRDIEQVNGVAPRALRRIRDRIENEAGPLMPGGQRVYHVGFPLGSVSPVLYMYDSANDFEPDRYDGTLFWGQPLPRTAPAVAPQSVAEIIGIAVQLRTDYAPGATDKPCGIGGELLAAILTKDQVRVEKLHEFGDNLTTT